MVARQNPAQCSGRELKRPAHSSSYAEHDAELAVAKIQFKQNQWKHEGFERRLSVVDGMSEAHQRKNGVGCRRKSRIRSDFSAMFVLLHFQF